MRQGWEGRGREGRGGEKGRQGRGRNRNGEGEGREREKGSEGIGEGEGGEGEWGSPTIFGLKVALLYLVFDRWLWQITCHSLFEFSCLGCLWHIFLLLSVTYLISETVFSEVHLLFCGNRKVFLLLSCIAVDFFPPCSTTTITAYTRPTSSFSLYSPVSRYYSCLGRVPQRSAKEEPLVMLVR